MKKIWIFNVLLLLNISICLANKEFIVEEESNISRTYFADFQTEIEIENKYGNIHVNTWTNDSVKMVINVYFKARNSSYLTNLKSNIDFEFVNTRHYVVAKTVFKSTSSAIYRIMKEAMDAEETVMVDWEIWVPKTSQLKLINRYGDIYAGNLDGKIDMTVEHGKIKVNDLTGETRMNLNFCDGDFNFIENGRLQIDYSNFNLDSGKEIKIESKTSELEINNIEKLIVNGKRDQYYIEKVKNLEIEGFFGTFDIETVTNNLYANLRYGNLRFENSAGSINVINVSSYNADVKFNLFTPGLSYSLDITHKKTRLVLPREIQNMNDQVINEKDEVYHLTGNVGNNSKAGKITLNLQNCEMFIYHK